MTATKGREMDNNLPGDAVSAAEGERVEAPHPRLPLPASIMDRLEIALDLGFTHGATHYCGDVAAAEIRAEIKAAVDLLRQELGLLP